MNGSQLKRIPYGETYFPYMQRENFAYVDKTRFIEELENEGTRYPFIVRPRRFGKSLFTQILQAYYDKAAAKDFDANFANTYIGKHKTALANQFYVLNFDFSGFGSDANLSEGLASNVSAGLCNFFCRYPHKDQDRILDAWKNGAADLLMEFCSFVQSEIRGKIFVIIDEFDQSANAILSGDEAAIEKLAKYAGAFRDFYATLKFLGKDGTVSRVFITGVTSVSMDSMTSGFNVATDLSNIPGFSEMFGFTEDEVRGLISELIDVKAYGKSVDEVLSRMKELYQGYRFSPGSEVTVFNPSSCLHYLKHIRKSNREPDQLIDPSVSSDLSKICGILNLARREDAQDIVSCAIRNKPIEFSGAPEVLNLQASPNFDKEKVLSALLYMGYLTFAPRSMNLVVPNRTIAQQFFDVYFQYIRNLPYWMQTKLSFYAEALNCLYKGDAKPIIEKIALVLESSFVKERSNDLREKDFQIALTMAANLASGYDYKTEYEVGESENHKVDLALFSRTESKTSYLFELKYLTKEKGTDAAVKKALENAKKQLNAEGEGRALQKYPAIKRVAAVFVGTQLAAFSQED